MSIEEKSGWERGELRRKRKEEKEDLYLLREDIIELRNRFNNGE